MVDVVLTTDMAVHFDLLSRFKEQIAAQPDISEWKDRTLLYQLLVHLADIANPSRPFHLARGWAERVIQEFCEQVRGAIEEGIHQRDDIECKETMQITAMGCMSL